jgi:hypothetical protein
MKTNKVAQAKQGAEPASAQAEGAGAMQRKVADTPRQMGEAAHIAQLKGDDKPKGKVPPPPKKGKGK